MKRLPSLLLLVASVLTPWHALSAPQFVDLDAPGALQDVREQRPEEYGKVVGILRDAARLPQAQVEGWVRTAYQAESVHLSQLLLVSLPPKRRLAFSLGDHSYAATVTVSAAPSGPMPVR